jgi:hypothetical protein
MVRLMMTVMTMAALVASVTAFHLDHGLFRSISLSHSWWLSGLVGHAVYHAAFASIPLHQPYLTLSSLSCNTT